MKKRSRESKLDRIEELVIELMSGRASRIKCCDNDICVFNEEGICIRPSLSIGETGECKDFKAQEIYGA